ncbi:MAG: hypothetical protein R3220_12060, partial [Balneolaceae bacterium]|nr:hypothetical protein [Balneolaceae bacterium]
VFAKKEVIEKAGFFEEGIRSGGDVRWTLKANDHGFSISYCDVAVVKKIARSAKELYKKRIRTGRGYYYSWSREPNRKMPFYNFFRSLKPPTFKKIRGLNPERYRPEFDGKIAVVWFHLYVTGIVEQVAFLSEYFRNKMGLDN